MGLFLCLVKNNQQKLLKFKAYLFGGRLFFWFNLIYIALDLTKRIKQNNYYDTRRFIKHGITSTFVPEPLK